MYSEDELARLEAIEKETKTFNSSQLNQYVNEGGIVRVWTKKYKEETQNGTVLNRDYQEQRKREYERAIREIRREQSISKEIWENALPEDKERLALEYYALKNRNNLMTREYERFCGKMGFPTEKNRIYYDGRGRLGGAIPKKYQPLLQKDSVGGIIKTGSEKDMLIRKANGLRKSTFYILSDKEIEHLKDEIKAIGADINIFSFNNKPITGYLDDEDRIYISGSVFPDQNSTHPRDLMSERAVIAHEYYGHRAFRNTSLQQGSWNDEFRASYAAAKNTPNLTDDDRRYLILDAIERAKESGVTIKYNEFMRGVIYDY